MDLGDLQCIFQAFVSVMPPWIVKEFSLQGSNLNSLLLQSMKYFLSLLVWLPHQLGAP